MLAKEFKLELLHDAINNIQDDDTILEMWNEYCEHSCNDEYKVYSMDELDDYFCMSSPTDIIDSIGDFRTSDYYFSMSDFGEVNSSDDVESLIPDSFDFCDELSEYVLETGFTFGVDKIEGLMETWAVIDKYEEIIDMLKDIDIDEYNGYIGTLKYDTRNLYRLEKVETES